MTAYDDRLTGHDTEDSLMDAAREIVEELAQDHYEACYDGSQCAMCAEDTPISKEWGPWLGKANQVDDLIEAVEGRLEALGEDPWWVSSELSGYYIDQFHAAAVDPAECAVCTGKIVEEDEGCGHESAGRPCPARE